MKIVSFAWFPSIMGKTSRTEQLQGTLSSYSSMTLCYLLMLGIFEKAFDEEFLNKLFTGAEDT